MTANIPNSVRKAVYRRDNFRCALCDSTDGLQVHHAIPRGRGGSSRPENLITLCWRCHGFIHSGIQAVPDTTPEEAAQACVEYLADLYPTDKHVWSPFK